MMLISTLTFSQTTVNIEPPIDDAFIFEGNPSNNYGYSPNLAVGYSTGYELRMLIKWDLSSLPSCINIISAEIRLNQWSNNASVGTDIERVNGVWDQNSVTWTNQPTTAGWYGSQTFSSTSGLKFIPATDLLNDWLIYGNNGVMFKSSFGSNSQSFDSGESNPDPRLIITYTTTTPPSIYPSSTNTNCGNCDGTATVNVSVGTSPYTYNWNNGQTIATITGLCAGNYSVTVTDANGCTDVTATTINSSTFTINPTNINVNSNSGNTSFLINTNGSWTVSESCSWLSVSPTSGTNNGTITITYNANTSANPRSCAITINCGSSTQSVTVTQSGTTSIEETASINNLNIYPNPNTGKFVIEISKIENLEIKLFNVFGEIIYEEKDFKKRIEFNLSDIQSGIYFLNIETEKGIARRKILVVK